jgi:hypothetical protein
MCSSVWVSKCYENCSNITFSVRESHLTFCMYFQITLYVCIHIYRHVCVYLCSNLVRLIDICFVKLTHLFNNNNNIY